MLAFHLSHEWLLTQGGSPQGKLEITGGIGGHCTVEELQASGEQRTAILSNILKYTKYKGELSPSKNYPAQKVDSIEVEKLWSV